jgi:hypothetical protein
MTNERTDRILVIKKGLAALCVVVAVAAVFVAVGESVSAQPLGGAGSQVPVGTPPMSDFGVSGGAAKQNVANTAVSIITIVGMFAAGISVAVYALFVFPKRDSTESAPSSPTDAGMETHTSS